MTVARRRSVLLALTLLAAAAAAAPGVAQAWVGQTPDTHHAQLAVLVGERLPEPLRSLLLKHREAFERGAYEPDANVQTFWHGYDVRDGGGGALYEVEKAVYDATMALRNDAPPEEIAYRMGYITHFSLDLAVPFHTGSGSYDHDLHLKYEHSAQLFQDELDLNGTRAPQGVADVRAAALALAHLSAAESPALLASLEPEGLSWTPEARDITERVLQAGLDTTADLLLTAFLQADPARPAPEPTHLQHKPNVRDPTDLGLGDGDFRRAIPWSGALMLGLGVLSLAAAVVIVAHRRRAI